MKLLDEQGVQLFLLEGVVLLLLMVAAFTACGFGATVNGVCSG